MRRRITALVDAPRDLTGFVEEWTHQWRSAALRWSQCCTSKTMTACAWVGCWRERSMKADCWSKAMAAGAICAACWASA